MEYGYKFSNISEYIDVADSNSAMQTNENGEWGHNHSISKVSLLKVRELGQLNQLLFCSLNHLVYVSNKHQ